MAPWAIGRRGRCAFSLVELLVVIAVIALLISLLLPALGHARQVARQMACSSNLRQIVTSINNYAFDHQEAIVGGATTSGREALEGRFNGIAVQAWDYIGPLASSMGMRGPGEGDDDPDESVRAARFDWYRRDLKGFACPSNSVQARVYAGDKPWDTGPMLSYNMSTQFTSTTDPIPKGTGSGWDQDRGAYQPMLYRIGAPDMKVAVFEGHRYADLWTEPDFDVELDAHYGGSFGGVGAWYRGSQEVNRLAAPGEDGRDKYLADPTGLNDARRWAFRHGNRGEAGLGAARVLGNMAFFDGHVRIFDDAEATNPDLWFPAGTRITSPAEFWNSTQADFAAKIADADEAKPYIVP